MNFKYYTAGRSKDLGSNFRDVTPEEDAFINKEIQAEYEKFVAHVSEFRHITPDTIKGEIGALAYGTDEAIRLKLIDGMKSKEEAYEQLAQDAGVAQDFKVMKLNNSVDFFGSLFGATKIFNTLRMSGADKSAARVRFCETNLLDKPLVFSGDISAVCK
jgi:ClpP class serine protease